MYSQNDEEQRILDYFGDFVGKFLDIGAYNGVKFSNTYRLAELGWSGVCVEPSSSVFPALVNLYKDNLHIQLVNCALDTHSCLKKFYDAGGYAVSSLDVDHKVKWEKSSGSKFREVYIKTVVPKEVFDTFGHDFHFISLDVEGTNFEVFSLLPFEGLHNLMAICVEHDGKIQQMLSLTEKFGFKELFRNSENLMLVKQ